MQKPDYNLHLENVKNAKFCKCRVVYVSARLIVVIWCHLAANRKRKPAAAGFLAEFFLMILPKKTRSSLLAVYVSVKNACDSRDLLHSIRYYLFNCYTTNVYANIYI